MAVQGAENKIYIVMRNEYGLEYSECFFYAREAAQKYVDMKNHENNGFHYYVKEKKF